GLVKRILGGFRRGLVINLTGFRRGVISRGLAVGLDRHDCIVTATCAGGFNRRIVISGLGGGTFFCCVANRFDHRTIRIIWDFGATSAIVGNGFCCWLLHGLAGAAINRFDRRGSGCRLLGR